MPLVPAKCTKCGADLQVDNSQECAICQHCGTPFIIEKAINNYHTYVSNNFTGANVTIMNGNKASFIERMFTFLQDNNWEQADQYCEKILDIDPKEYRAYLGKYLSEKHFQDINGIVADPINPSLNTWFKRALTLCDDSFMNNILELWFSGKYKIIVSRYTSASASQDIKALQDIAKEFEKIRNYRDSSEYIGNCHSLIQEFTWDNNLVHAKQMYKSSSSQTIKKEIRILKQQANWKDTEQVISKLNSRLRQLRRKTTFLFSGCVLAIIVCSILLLLSNRHSKLVTLQEHIENGNLDENEINEVEKYYSTKKINTTIQKAIIVHFSNTTEIMNSEIGMLSFAERKEIITNEEGNKILSDCIDRIFENQSISSDSKIRSLTKALKKCKTLSINDSFLQLLYESAQNDVKDDYITNAIEKFGILSSLGYKDSTELYNKLMNKNDANNAFFNGITYADAEAYKNGTLSTALSQYSEYYEKALRAFTSIQGNFQEPEEKYGRKFGYKISDKQLIFYEVGDETDGLITNVDKEYCVYDVKSDSIVNYGNYEDNIWGCTNITGDSFVYANDLYVRID